MRKIWRTTIVASAAALLLGTVALSAPAYGAHHHAHHDAAVSGQCSMSGRWRMELDHMGMMDRIGVHYEIWNHTAGQMWRVNLRHDGMPFMHGTYMMGHHGHLMVHTWTHDRVGRDRIVGKAVNQATGEVCRGVLSIRDA